MQSQGTAPAGAAAAGAQATAADDERFRAFVHATVRVRVNR